MNPYETDPQRHEAPTTGEPSHQPADASHEGNSPQREESDSTAAQPIVGQPVAVPPAAPQSGIPQSAAPQSGAAQPAPWQQHSPWQQPQAQQPGYGQQYYGQQQHYAYAGQQQPQYNAQGGWTAPDAQPAWAAPVGTEQHDPARAARGRRVLVTGAVAVLIALGAGGVGAATALAFNNNNGTATVQSANSSVTRVVDRSSLAQIAAAVQDSVVSITTESGEGSGVILSADGYILTNNHVVENADEIKVELTDDRTLTAKLVGTDKASDLALLKVTAGDLHPIALGNSENVKVGDVVLAVGNPLGVGQTVTMGIISAKGRSTTVGDGGYEDFLQTDAPINHGNSGGALVNTKGELVGINSQILSSNDGNIGIGFAIPSNMAKNVMDQLRTKGKVTRAQLGVTVQPVTSDMAESLGLKHAGGAIVSSVAPGSAAEKAGVKREDVIQAFNGQPIHDFNTLRNRVAESGPGSTADLTVIRDGSEKHLSVKLDEATASKSARTRESEPGTSDDKTSLGVAVAPLTPELAERAHASKDAHGLIVEDVNPNGRAADAGIQPGDVIQEVNRQPVKSIDDLRAALRKTSDKPTLLLIQRQGTDIFVTVKPANG
jgi:Do/DeqQ family serine protease